MSNFESLLSRNSASSMSNPDISVIIPVLNEAGAIIPLIMEISRVLTGKIKHEIIVVDDGSTDATPTLLLGLINNPELKLRVIRHLKNYGQSAALYTGIQVARTSWIVTMDGDGQNNPEDVMKLLNARDNSAIPELKAICGYRKKRQDTIVKIISSRVANYIRGFLLQDMTPDTGCGLKLLNRDTFLNLPYFDHMHRFIPALIRRAGFNVVSIQITHRPRTAGQSKYGVIDRLCAGIIDLIGMLWLIRRCKIPTKEEIHIYDY